MASKDGLELSVCVVTWNARDDIDSALRSVLSYTVPASTEVIVVDNDSTDGTVELVREKYPQVCLIRNAANVGYAPAMNLALVRARGQFVLTLSQDAELLPGAVEALLSFMRSHPAAGLVGPKTLDADGQMVTTLHHPSLLLSVWTEIIPLKQWLRRRHFVRRALTRLMPNSSGLTSDYATTHQVPVLDGGCLMIRRSVIDTVGLLDPMIPQGPDDYDWCYRIRQAGLEIWYVAESEIVHRTSPKEELANLSPTYLRARMPQFCYLYGKYHGGMSARFFNLSAYLLAFKWQVQARRRYGTDSEEMAALRDATGLCLHPERYADEYKTLWSR